MPRRGKNAENDKKAATAGSRRPLKVSALVAVSVLCVALGISSVVLSAKMHDRTTNSKQNAMGGKVEPIKAKPSTPPQPSKPPKPSYYRLAKAISDTEEGATTGPKYKQVVGYYLKSLKASPKMPGAGFMYYALSDHLDVAKGQTKRSVLQKAVKAIPTYYLMYFDLGYEMNGEEADYKTSLYLKSYALQPQHSSTNYNLGLQKKSVGNYDGALEHFRTFCTNSPLDELGYNNMALTFKSADRENEAFATYLKALPLTPNRFRTYISLGAFLTDASAPISEKALTPEMMALADDFALSIVTYNYGLYLKNSDNFKRCVEMMSRSISHDADYNQAYYQLGSCQHSEGDNDNAQRSMKRALYTDPGMHTAYNSLADILSYLGGEDADKKLSAQALTNWRKTITIEGHDSTTYFDVGLHCKTYGQYEEGLHYYRRFLWIKSSSYNTYLNMGNANIAGDLDFEEGVRNYRQSIMVYPQFLRAYVTMANALGETQRGVAFYNIVHNFKLFHKAVSLAPTLTHNSHFQQYNQLGDLTRPQTTWQQAIDQEKSLVGLYAKGKVALPPAIQATPNATDSYLNLANVLEDENKILRMEETYKKVLKMSSENAESYSHFIYDFTMPLPLPWKDEGHYHPEDARLPKLDKEEVATRVMNLSELMITCDRGDLSQSTWLKQARDILQQQGIVIVDKFLSEDLVAQVRKIVKGMADKAGFDKNLNINEAEKRQDFSVPIRGPVQEMFDEIISHLLPLFTKIFKQQGVYLIDSGVVISYPGARAQIIHRDVALLKGIPHFNFGAAKTYTIQVPLVKMTLEMGPLEVVPGTHYKTESNSAEPIQTLFDLGSITVYGTTLKHRGGLNNGNSWRPTFYFTFMGRGLSPYGLTYRIPPQHVGRFEGIGTPHIQYIGDSNVPL